MRRSEIVNKHVSSDLHDTSSELHDKATWARRVARVARALFVVPLLLSVGSCSTGGVGGGAGGDDPPVTNPCRIEGTWTGDMSVEGQISFPAEIEFAAGSFDATMGALSYEGTYIVRPADDPAQIDLTIDEQPNPDPDMGLVRGIYELRDACSNLRMAVDISGGPRPTEFLASQPVTLLDLNREGHPEQPESAVRVINEASLLLEERLAAGRGRAALDETLAQLLADPSIADASIAEDERSILVVPQEGPTFTILALREDSPGSWVMPPARDPTTDSLGLRRNAQSVDPVFGAEPPSSKALSGLLKRMPCPKRAALFLPFENDYVRQEELYPVNVIEDALRSAQYEITKYRNAAATTTAWADLLEGDYGVIVVRSHGNLGFDGTVHLITREPVPRESQEALETRVSAVADRLGRDPDLFGFKGTTYFSVGPPVATKHSFSHSFVWAGFCSSLQNDTMAQGFLANGADVYLGYTDAIQSEINSAAAGVFFDALRDPDTSIASAYDLTKNDSDLLDMAWSWDLLLGGAGGSNSVTDISVFSFRKTGGLDWYDYYLNTGELSPGYCDGDGDDDDNDNETDDDGISLTLHTPVGLQSGDVTIRYDLVTPDHSLHDLIVSCSGCDRSFVRIVQASAGTPIVDSNGDVVISDVPPGSHEFVWDSAANMPDSRTDSAVVWMACRTCEGEGTPVNARTKRFTVDNTQHGGDDAEEGGAVAAPTFDPPDGTTFTESLDITINCATPGATIHFTEITDFYEIDSIEAAPATTSATETKTIEAYASKDGMQKSPKVAATYTRIVSGLPTISHAEVSGSLTQGETGTVEVSCVAIDADGPVESVTADLSEIGGSQSQPLTNMGNSSWYWYGRVTPLNAGIQTITFTALDDTANAGMTTSTITILAAGGGVPFSGMALIPAGEFQMGDTLYEGNDNERPVHRVYVDAFYIDTCEVTNQQYCDALNWADAQGGMITVTGGVVYMDGSGTSHPYCNTRTSNSDSRITWSGSRFGVVSGTEDHPMTLVSWYGAVAYCNWRSAMEGKPLSYDLSDWSCEFGGGYRLPTEAEWEKAARGGASGMRFPWSDQDTIQHSRCNYYSSSDYAYDTGSTGGYHPLWGAGSSSFTSPVEFFNGALHDLADWGWPGSPTDYQTANSVNGYGLYGMAGNVSERCNDWFSSEHYNTPEAAQPNPVGPDGGTKRVVRGGGWADYANKCRVANRHSQAPDARYVSTGFRCVLGSP